MTLISQYRARQSVAARYSEVRATTERLAANLSAEDQCVQSMADASPTKWHRAHTTWFFEQFVLCPYLPGYEVFDPSYGYLFNSYYDGVGTRQPQSTRGLITRPGVEEIGAYREHVDMAVVQLLAADSDRVANIIEVGLQHEQQHQELLVTDILHAFAHKPNVPAVLPEWREAPSVSTPTHFVACAGGLVEIGSRGADFCFDNETPRHRVFLQPYLLGSHVVRNSEWLDFMADGGYRTPSLWMSDGWAIVNERAWAKPLYWREVDGVWYQAGPNGLALLSPTSPVRHISWYEADAYARWAAARLPTEMEWEAALGTAGLAEMTGHVWQWTGSSYRPYPGFRPAAGLLGEYNAKFMVNQMVLRGGSAVTPAGHARPTYRNFFYPDRRWQFSGVRLAQDV
jgi:ergothioneine biosynthesis protein EgtB